MVSAADIRAAGFLIGTILAYGAIMFPLSGVRLSSLLHVLGDYAVIAAYSVVLVGAAYAAVCIVSPVTHRRMNDRLFWLLIAGLLVWLTIPLFGLFKQLVLPDRGFVWDSRLAHLAMATLMLIAASKRGALLTILFGVYWLLIWIGSVHFGWHYFVDGPVATLMMVGVWKLAGIIAREMFPVEADHPSCAGPAADS